MGDHPKQKGDSDYCDSEFNPALVDFLLRDDNADEPEEHHPLASSSAAAAAPLSIAAELSEWEKHCPRRNSGYYWSVFQLHQGGG